MTGNGAVIVPLTDILKTEPLVLADTGISREFICEWPEGLFIANSFAKLNQTQLGLAIQNVEYLLGWYGQPNVFTVDGVAAELQRVYGIVHEKLTWLNSNDRMSNRRTDHGHAAKRSARMSSSNSEEGGEGNEGKVLLESLTKAYFKVQKAALKRVVKRSDETAYKKLEGIVLEIAARTSAKLGREGRHLRYHAPTDLYADEQLVASAIYLSAVEDKRCAIVSIDSDIYRLANDTLEYLRFSTVSGLNDFFRHSASPPVLVYHSIENGQARLYLGTSGFSPRGIERHVKPQVIEAIDSRLSNPESDRLV